MNAPHLPSPCGRHKCITPCLTTSLYFKYTERVILHLSLNFLCSYDISFIKRFIFFTIELPNRVSNIRFSNITSSSAIVLWSDSVTKTEPYNYIIDCIGCYKRSSFPVETEQTYVILKNLDASSLYYITVAVNNNITMITGKWLYESRTFHTRSKGKQLFNKCKLFDGY